MVFRQSCIYGQRQFGVEDQGWVAWFSIAAMLERPITIYGDGLQIRDLLHVDDLVAAYKAAADKPEHSAGKIFNMGGGPTRTLSLVELLAFLEKRLERKIPVSSLRAARRRSASIRRRHPQGRARTGLAAGDRSIAGNRDADRLDPAESCRRGTRGRDVLKIAGSRRSFRAPQWRVLFVGTRDECIVNC